MSNDPTSRRSSWLSGLLCLTAAATFMSARSGIALNHDVAWLLIAAGRMLAGGHFQTDFFEVNMPQAIALYAPVQLLHQWLGIALPLALPAWLLVLIVQCLLLVRAIAVRSGEAALSALAYPAALCWLALVLVLLPGYDFGQREHLAVVLSLPFVVLISGSGRGLPSALRFYVSVLAGLGLFIKPHFALLPPLLLLLRAREDRSSAVFKGPEALALLTVALAEALALALKYGDWFVCARWAADLYSAYRQPHFYYLFQDSSVILTAGAFVLLGAAVIRQPAVKAASMPFLVASAYSAAAYLLQGKGWSYQFLPAMLFLAAGVPVACTVMAAKAETASHGFRRALVPVAILLFIGQAVLAGREAPRAADLHASVFGKMARAASKGDSIYVFSTSVAAAFPAVVQLDLGWASRYSALWPLAGLAQALQSPDPGERAKLNRYAGPLVDSVDADLRRYHPSIVIVDKRSHQFGLPPGFNILEFFLHSARFRETWSGYEQIGKSTDFDIYRDRSRSREELPAEWRQ